MNDYTFRIIQIYQYGFSRAPNLCNDPTGKIFQSSKFVVADTDRLYFIAQNTCPQLAAQCFYFR